MIVLLMLKMCREFVGPFFLTNGLEGCHYKLFVVIIVVTVLIPSKKSDVCTNLYGTSDCAVPFLYTKL